MIMKVRFGILKCIKSIKYVSSLKHAAQHVLNVRGKIIGCLATDKNASTVHYSLAA